jgi:predicted phage terminase large subunit-like protein
MAESAPRPRSSTDESLRAYFRRIHPADWVYPVHLAAVFDAFEKARLAIRREGPPVFLATSIPPQHGKTSAYLTGQAWLIEGNPEAFGGYVTYGQRKAERESTKVRDWVRGGGTPIRDDTTAKAEWRTQAGGGLMAAGIDASITGFDALRHIVVDDPHKNRKAAESRLQRDAAWDEFMGSVWTRRHANTSIFVNHTRWNPDDMIARVMKVMGDHFAYVNFPAILPDGAALFPELHPIEKLREDRRFMSAYDWQSLYMGDPQPKGSRVFYATPPTYTELPPAMTVAIGVDLAYAGKKVSDWSVAWVMGKHRDVFYVLDVVRRQCTLPEFVEDLKRLRQRYAAPMMIYGSGVERGTADSLRMLGVPLMWRPASTDKHSRAQLLAAAWNDGRVQFPQAGAWREPTLATFEDFTGVNDPHDDEVDAAVAAFDQLNEGVAMPGAGDTVAQPDISRTWKRRRAAW